VRLMNAAVKLIPLDGLRPITIKTLIGLLASSGLRPGEAVRLRCQDVSLNDGTLTIQNSKGWKQRMIPISLSTVAALKAYDMQRNQLNPFSQTGAFFEFDNDQPLNIRSADHAFKVIREATGLVTDLNGRLSRLYDLRHTFVCRRVIEWYETDENVDSRVAQLSCYLGHKKVSDTYWYLTAIPALMAHAADKSNGYGNFGGVS
jgi:integrase/recombinase XerD